jgi:hypothetical protein
MTTIARTEKKRGRPPKNQIIQKPVKHIEKPYQNEQLVLFLESFDSSDEKEVSEKTETEKNKKLSDKKTFGKTTIIDNLNKANTKNNIQNKQEYDSDENNFLSDTNSDEEKSDNSNIKFNHLTETNRNDDSDSEYTNVNLEKLLDEIKKRDLIISTLKSKIKEKMNFSENIIAMTKDNKKTLNNLGLIQINKNKPVYCDKTEIACWWCTYNFDTLPTFLPDQYRNSVYYVFGNFCSFSCMLAYNQNMDDYKKSIRNALIKQLYLDIFKNNLNLKPAGPRELLKKFGGPMDITTYRDPNYICTKQLKMNLPPMIPLISEIEEIELDS